MLRLQTLSVALVALMTALVGCDTVSFKGAGARASVPAGEWPFAPVSMRVHPFTAIEKQGEGEDAALVLEARLELVDQLGDVTKGVGAWRFELYGDRGRGQSRERLEVWEAPMTTLAENARHWDPITRTYAFRLRLSEQPDIDRELTLVAQLTDPRGNHLIAEGEVAREDQ